MNLLAIDTATEACSAAVLREGRLYERFQLAPREHNRLILPMISELLKESGVEPAELHAIAFGCGPGSFTGVRIAAGVTQGLALGLDLPVIPISTLAALSLEAMDAESAELAYACIDARMNEVYWGVYERECEGSVRLIGCESVMPAANVRGLDGKLGVGVGSGWATYSEVLADQLGNGLGKVLADRFPRAGLIAKLGAQSLKRGGGLPAEQAMPVYLRDNVARKPDKRV
jgi:tRNA threonylcarbamoyladenosine biosynthesis protein TsaB